MANDDAAQAQPRADGPNGQMQAHPDPYPPQAPFAPQAGPPAYPPGGYPPQGYPQQQPYPYPPQGYPPQEGYPQGGYPQQGYPQQQPYPYPPQGYPGQHVVAAPTANPVTVVVTHTKKRKDQGMMALIVFIAGWFFCPVWCVGWTFIGKKNDRTTRIFGWLSVGCAIVTVIWVIIVIAVVVSTAVKTVKTVNNWTTSPAWYNSYSPSFYYYTPPPAAPRAPTFSPAPRAPSYYYNSYYGSKANAIH